MTVLKMERKELGRSTWNDTYNTRTLIRTPHVCHRHLAGKRSLYCRRA